MIILSYFKHYGSVFVLKWSFLLVLFLNLGTLPVYSQTNDSQANRITLRLNNATLKNALTRIEAQSQYIFFYNNDLIDSNVRVSVNASDRTMEQVLDEILNPTPYTYRISGRQIYITMKSENTASQTNVQTSVIQTITITGRVVDKSGEPITGATVYAKHNTSIGTYTTRDGQFTLVCPPNSTLVFSFIGYESREVVADKTTLNVVLSETVSSINEIVVTGIVNRDAATYTGSATRISGEELRRVGNQNVFQSLKNLEPSLYIMDNFTSGSDPNALPDMILRGTTSFPYSNTVDGFELKGNYQNTPNMPLFMVDGFETKVERVMDMDMNRIESLTILKDASAKALYGSKAANGVIIIETRRLSGGNQTITYTASVDITMPDLTSYDLCNAAEKLEAERLDGMFGSTMLPTELQYRQAYMDRLKLVNEGLDTYWLSKPLRVGVGQKHNVNIELGDSRSLKTVIDFAYNDVAGVMKGSERKTLSGSVNISYRTKYITFRNIMTATNLKSKDSPWGKYSQYTKMNPYWQATDPVTGETLRVSGYELNRSVPILNPMYDAQLGTLYAESYFDFLNNFYAELNLFDALKVVARLGVSTKRSDADEFLPALHSSFAEYTMDADKEKRGSYRLDNGKGSSYSGDLIITYYKNFDKHSLFVNGTYSIAEDKYSTYMHRAEGFPTDKGADITFARRYAEGSRPIGTSGLTRNISFLGMANYTYDNRYYVDFNLRYSASSLFGTGNRWTPGWSVGVGWNLHNESFLKDFTNLRRLKLRGSYGVTGNQNFNTNEAVGTYLFYTDSEALYHNNTGAYLSKLPNPWLKMEERKDLNVGLEMDIKGFSLKVEAYNSLTENMITSITTSLSSGFKNVKENLGKVRNTGIEVAVNLPIVQTSNGFLSLHSSIASNKNKIVELSESLKEYNERQEKAAADKGNSTPVLIYKDGQSMNTLWVVPSLGIDPMNGQEIYVKQDGSKTYTYDALDLKPLGNSKPKYTGIFGLTAE